VNFYHVIVVYTEYSAKSNNILILKLVLSIKVCFTGTDEILFHRRFKFGKWLGSNYHIFNRFLTLHLVTHNGGFIYSFLHIRRHMTFSSETLIWLKL